jgi:hypothetical protein
MLGLKELLQGEDDWDCKQVQAFFCPRLRVMRACHSCVRACQQVSECVSGVFVCVCICVYVCKCK